MEKHSSLKLIAQLLGISKMTVSRALREGTSVDPDLRAKVRETARQIGYQPDSRISQAMRAVRKAQASSYRETLAFISPHASSSKEVNAMRGEELEGARRRAQHLGYKLDEFCMTEKSHSGGDLSSILASRNIRGVLISPPASEINAPRLTLDWAQFCCVVVGRSFPGIGLARVEHDYYYGCALALQHLKRLRYQRVGLIMSQALDARTARLIRSAFITFHPAGLKPAGNLIFRTGHEEPHALKKWIVQHKPDALLAHFDNIFPRLEEIKGNIPKGTGLASLNWNKSRPTVAGIDQHESLLGEQAIDFLLLRLQSNQYGLARLAPAIKVPGSWISGASVKKNRPVSLPNR
jgi:DNA-binding LacI/PurR family transcriptional regulator